MVEIKEERLKELEDIERWMNVLDAAGIDNCEAVAYAHELRRENPEDFGYDPDDEDI